MHKQPWLLNYLKHAWLLTFFVLDSSNPAVITFAKYISVLAGTVLKEIHLSYSFTSYAGLMCKHYV